MTINIDTHNNERNLFHFAREKLKKMLYTVLCAFGGSITFLSEERRIYNEYRRKMVQIFGEYGDDDEDGDFMNYHLPLHKLSWIALTHNSSTSTSTSFSSWIIVEEYIKCLQHLNAVNRAIVSKDGELGNTPLKFFESSFSVDKELFSYLKKSWRNFCITSSISNPLCFTMPDSMPPTLGICRYSMTSIRPVAIRPNSYKTRKFFTWS